MKQTQIIMGMPVTLEVITDTDVSSDLTDVFGYFRQIDEQFSPYKDTSEVSRMNAQEITPADASPEMTRVLQMCEQARNQTNGYFNAYHNGKFDPSGIVKGWAILNAANILATKGFKNYYVDVAGDIQISGVSDEGKWSVGIRNPFAHEEIVKVLKLSDVGIATSGTAVRGQHIYDPHRPGSLDEILSITVVGPDVYEADRFATAAFAMQRQGVYFIESLPGFEAYAIDKQGVATMTSGFERYISDL